MSTTANGSFQVAKWDESTYEEMGDGAKLTRVTIVHDFTGGLEGTVSWQGQMYYRTDGTAVYTALERFVGTLEGRSGASVATTSGGYDGTAASDTWTVVSGSGTGDLAGIEGSGKAAAGAGTEGTYSFECTFG
jgi:hypothetical protein